MVNRAIAGADGCKGGWVVIREAGSGAGITWDVVPSIRHLFDAPNAPSLLTIDIPIGLPLIGSRECDMRARRLLGPGRGSSVFPAPIRPVLVAPTYAEACDTGSRIEGKRLPAQAWGIVPKIREVDLYLRDNEGARTRIREVHPEVCFYFMGGKRPMVVNKKKREGRDERAALLRPHFGEAIETALGDLPRLGCAADDLIDAFAALWTARRIVAGTAISIPETPVRDTFGLPMEMVA